jgi:hypothetical protein
MLKADKDYFIRNLLNDFAVTGVFLAHVEDEFPGQTHRDLPDA